MATTQLPPFSAALTRDAVKECTEAYPEKYIKNAILTLSFYLLKLADTTNFFGPDVDDDLSVSLRVMYFRLHDGKLGPNPLDAKFLEEARIIERSEMRTTVPVIERPLADFEDIYYALISRMKEMHHLMNMRLKSGFNEIDEPIFEGGPTMNDLHNSLEQFWSVLNEPGLGKALDDASRRAEADAMHDEIIFRAKIRELTEEEAEEDLQRLWDSEIYDGIQGLHYINSFSPAMISVFLDQKYGLMLQLEAQTKAKNARKEKLTTIKKKTPHFDPVRVASNMYYSSLSDTQKMDLVYSEWSQEQLARAIDWQIRYQRVKEYCEYLRQQASESACDATEQARASVSP